MSLEERDAEGNGSVEVLRSEGLVHFEPASGCLLQDTLHWAAVEPGSVPETADVSSLQSQMTS